MVFVIPRKKVLIPRNSGFTIESIPKRGMEWNYMKKLVLTKNSAPANRIESMFFSTKCFGTEFRELLLFLFHGKEFRVVFSSTEWFGAEFQVFAYILAPQKGIPV
jgi:hypothetical protein